MIRGIEIARSRERAQGREPPVALRPLILAPYYERHIIHQRIAERLHQRLQAGLLDEVRELNKRGLSWERLEYFGLEYRYAARYLKNEIDMDTFLEQLLVRIRKFCKAQDVWFRKMEREGKDIYWLEQGDFDEACRLTRAFLAGEILPEPSFRLKDIDYGRYDKK